VDELITMELANLRNKYGLKKGREPKPRGRGGRGTKPKPKKFPGQIKNREPADMLSEVKKLYA
jgi:hypothetical protein